MKLYLSIIFIAGIVLSLVNAFITAPIFGFVPWFAAVASAGSVAGVFTLDIVVACVIKFLFPSKCFAPEKKFFKSAKGEKNFYEKMGIRKWKDKIPETGKLLKQFDKTKIGDKNNPKHIYTFLCETGYAEVMHWLSIPIGFLIIVIFPIEYLPYCYLFGIPCAIVNLFLQIPPIMVQRYNRPKLLRLYERAVRIAEQQTAEQNAETETAQTEETTQTAEDTQTNTEQAKQNTAESKQTNAENPRRKVSEKNEQPAPQSAEPSETQSDTKQPAEETTPPTAD